MTRRRVPAGWSAPRGLVVVLAVAVLGAAPGRAATAREWREVLERAAEAARSTPYAGEALVVSTVGEAAEVTRLHVRSSARGGLVVGGGDDRWRVALHDAGGDLVHEGEGWAVPLPAIDLGAGDDLRRLAGKYEVALTGADRLMGRPCTTLAISRRSDGALRERLWVDDASGLVVRRERYEDGPDPVRLAAFLSLDLDPGQVAAGDPLARDPAAEVAAAGAPARPVLDAVSAREVAALRQAGWAVPDALPGGYAPVGVYAIDAVASHPLQLVYTDGLYVVSVFQQRGRADWSSLPPGAAPVEDLGFPAYWWPGAVPPRLVWQAGERTWSVVGEAPEEELLALAAALPRAEPPRLLERLRRGLGRIWSILTPWDED